MRRQIIRTKQIECAEGNAPEYARHRVAVDLTFATNMGLDSEITVMVYNRKMHMMGTETVFASPKYSGTRRFHLEINASYDWECGQYLFYVLRNGKPRWKAAMQLWGQIGWEEKGYLEPIEKEGKEMNLLNRWTQTQWLSKLDQMKVEPDFWNTFTDWVMEYDRYKQGQWKKVFPCIFVVGNVKDRIKFANDVLVHYLTDDSPCMIDFTMVYLMSDKYALRDIQASVNRYTVIVINLSLGDEKEYDEKKLHILANLIQRSSFTRTQFVLHGSSFDVERLVSSCSDFYDMLQTNNRIVFPNTPKMYLEPMSTCSPEDDFDELLDDYIRNLQDDRTEEEEETLPDDMDKQFKFPPTPLPFDLPNTTEKVNTLEQDVTKLQAEHIQLDQMVGMERLKQEIADARTMALFNKTRRELQLDKETEHRYHMLFFGNPGTGKTTVANLIAKMYHDMGLLSSGHTVETNRAKLVGEYIGQTEMKTLEAIESARGGVLFIDEAYTLISTEQGSKDFGKEVLNTLLSVLSEPNPDMIVILAGYEDKMERLIHFNPGLKDRFPLHFHFDDYTPDQLMCIAKGVLDKRHFELTCEAEAHLRLWVKEEVEQKNANFSNGRWVHNIIEHGVVVSMARRVMQQSMATPNRELFSRIEAVDIDSARCTMEANKMIQMKSVRRIGFSA